MGNRAGINFEDHKGISLYIHWNGSPESVLAFIEYTGRHMSVRSPLDFVARLSQVIGNFFGGTNSLSIRTEHTFEEHTYVIAANDKGRPYIKTYQGKKFTAAQEDKARNHVYWQELPDQMNIMQVLEDANDRFFIK